MRWRCPCGWEDVSPDEEAVSARYHARCGAWMVRVPMASSSPAMTGPEAYAGVHGPTGRHVWIVAVDVGPFGGPGGRLAYTSAFGPRGEVVTPNRVN